MSLVAAHEALIGAAAIRAAVELRVLERMGERALDACGLAEARGLNERGSRSLLVALAALGVVEPVTSVSYRATHGAPLAGPMLALHGPRDRAGGRDAGRRGPLPLHRR